MAAASTTSFPITTYEQLYQQQVDVLGEQGQQYVAAFMDRFGTEESSSGDETPETLCTLVVTASQVVPKVLVYMTIDGATDAPVIRVMHRVTTVPPAMVATLATRWDNQAFAFASDVTVGPGNNNINVSVVHFPTGDAGTNTAEPFGIVAAVTVPSTLSEMDNTWTAASGADSCIGPFVNGAASTEQLRARRLVPVPQHYIHLVLGRTFTPRQFWEDVIGAIRADNNEVMCATLVNWARVASTYRRRPVDDDDDGNRNSSSTNPPIQVDPVPLAPSICIAPPKEPVVDADLQRLVWTWLIRDLPALAANFTTDFISQRLHQMNMITAAEKDAGFPILMRVALVDEESYLERFASAEGMIPLIEEVAKAFQRCAVAESQLSIEERKLNQVLFESIGTVETFFSKRAEQCPMEQNDPSGACAFLMLYTTAITAPTNLQALYRMCDPRIRTGPVRCYAIHFLNSLGVIPAAWNIQMPPNENNSDDGNNNNSDTCFYKNHMTVMANFITQKGFCTYPKGKCRCEEMAFQAMDICFRKALETESATDILEFCYSRDDWPAILQGKNKLCIDSSTNPAVFYDLRIFVQLHDVAQRVLRMDANNSRAKSFVREQLGSCHELLITVLRRIVAGDIHAQISNAAASSPGRDKLDEIQNAVNFLQRFMNCLVPVPMDRETRALLRRARNALLEPIFEAMSSTSPNAFSLPTDSLKLQRIQVANRLISDMYRWADFHTESEQERWERYTEAFRLFSAPTERRLVRRLWKEQQKAQRAAASAQDTSRTMCSNCFVLRKAFLEECSECMLDCGRCRRVVYCSRECQVEHWKKGHKNQCRTVETL